MLRGFRIPLPGASLELIKEIRTEYEFFNSKLGVPYMILFQLRTVIDDKTIHVRLHLDQTGEPGVGNVIYDDDVPLAKVLSCAKESVIENFEPFKDYIIYLDRKLPYTSVGSVLQIG